MTLLRSITALLLLSLHNLATRPPVVAFTDANRRSQRSPSVPMASSQPDETLPNWRTVNPDATNRLPPFSHPLDTHTTAAPWSPAAIQSSLALHAQLTQCDDPYLKTVLSSSLHDLEMAYRLYGPYCMVGSYNGGKDACVIFHLMRAVHARHCTDLLETQQQRQETPGAERKRRMIPRPRVIYFQHADEFPSVTSLLHSTVNDYDAEMLAFREGTSFPRGLKYLVENNHPPNADGQYPASDGAGDGPPHPLAFVLGTRSDDPNAGSQGTYAPSSHYMPPFLRVNPILRWTYGHVWRFLRAFDLEYCQLYDEGYTSLGTTKDTVPCPALKREGGGYWPAYLLWFWGLERAGRVDTKKREKEEGDGKKHEPTMSQTSSTVSLPDSSVEESVSKATDADAAPAISAIDETTLPRPPTVALVVIGDELLKGLTSDANVLSASRALRSRNVSLARVSIISDDSQTIVEEIRRMSKEADVVITSGGVGPTHDDVTVRSVAEACGAEIELNCEMARLLADKMGSEDVNGSELNADELFARLPEALRKMAGIPAGSTLRYLSADPKKDEWPVLQCDNIFVLPGVPNYFQQQIEQLASHLSSPSTIAELSSNCAPSSERDGSLKRLASTSPPPRSDTYRLVLSMDENSIVSELNATVQANPHVSFGSYPLVDHPRYKTIITLEGRFYNGGYTRGSERLLGRALSDLAVTMDADVNGEESRETYERRESSRQSLYFSKEEMDSNVKIALEDLKSRLPPESIVKVDTNDHLTVDQA